MLKRQKFNSTKKKLLNRKFIFAVLILIFVVALGYLSTKYLTIKTIDLKLGNLYCIDQARLKSEIALTNKNILLVNESDTRQKLLKQYPCIGSIRLKKIYPQKIEISIDSRKPKLTLNLLKQATSSDDLNPDEILIATGSSFLNIPLDLLVSDKKLVSDENGIVFSDDPLKFNVIQTDYIGRWFKLGDYIGESIVRVIEIFERLPKMGLIFSHSLILGDKFLIVQAHEKIIFNLKKPQDFQLASLQLILQKAKIESKAIDTIDLRFDKPVVTFSQKKN